MRRGRDPVPPVASREQRLRALGQANEIRGARARLKRELAASSVRLEEVIAAPPSYAATAKVYELLLALPKFGPVRASRTLKRCRIAQAKTVADLSERQRAELIAYLRH